MNGGDNMLVLAFMAPWLSSILWVLLGFVIGAIAAIVVTLIDKAPSKEAVAIFDKATDNSIDD